MVPKGRRVFPSLSVENNLRVGGFGVAQGVQDPRRRDLRAVPGAGRAAQAVGLLALGRRSADARDRAGADVGARIVLLDEPSLGLAPIVVASVLDTMTKLSERGIAILAAEQSARLAQRFADEIHVIDSGRMQLVRKGGPGVDQNLLQVAYLGGHHN